MNAPFVGQKVTFRPHEPNRPMGVAPRLLTGTVSMVCHESMVNIGYLDEDGSPHYSTSVTYCFDGIARADVVDRFCYPAYYGNAADPTTIRPAAQQSSIPPEPHRINYGDIVQVKGGVGPKMTVVGEDQDRADWLECVYWDTSRGDYNRFESVFVHRDALAYFGDPLPSPPNSAVAEVEGNTCDAKETCNVGAGCKSNPKLPKTTSVEFLNSAIDIGLPLAEKVGAETSDYRLRGAIKILANEVKAHVDLN